MPQEDFNFWQDHSIRFLEMAFRQDRQEAIENPDGYGKRTGECGDTVEIFLSVQDGCIERLSYRIDGCLSTNACANAIAYLAEGKSVAGAWEITPESLIRFLETLPEKEHHCAELAAGAFYLALTNYRDLAANPWKRSYRRRPDR